MNLKLESERLSLPTNSRGTCVAVKAISGSSFRLPAQLQISPEKKALKVAGPGDSNRLRDWPSQPFVQNDCPKNLILLNCAVVIVTATALEKHGEDKSSEPLTTAKEKFPERWVANAQSAYRAFKSANSNKVYENESL